jgi:hypothetical protein
MNGPNREQWRVIFAAYAAALFIQRDNLTDTTTATGFLVAGAALLMWRLSHGQSAMTAAEAKQIGVTVVAVVVVLWAGTAVLNRLRSSPYDAMPPSASTAGGSSQPEGLPAMPGGPPPALPPTRRFDAQMIWTPATLIAAYQADGFGTSEALTDRFIQLAGLVNGVRGSEHEVPYIELVIPERREFMQAMFPQDGEQIRGLRQGDEVMVSCTPAYDPDIENAVLQNCSLVR